MVSIKLKIMMTWNRANITIPPKPAGNAISLFYDCGEPGHEISSPAWLSSSTHATDEM